MTFLTALQILLGVVALYPPVTAAMWIAGGIWHRVLDERIGTTMPPEGWPGVTILIPAYNEGPTIATSVRAALASNYPEFEVLVLDDGSSDDTAERAREVVAGDRRARVIEDPVNQGKGERLNIGFGLAKYPLVVVTDADSHLHPEALRYLAAVMESSPQLAAVTGAPHVTNRATILAELQVLEAAAVIGLIRRTQTLTGRVGTVAGVLGMFRKGRVLAVGGYDGRMATEDIDLTWRLLLSGWTTAQAPHALVGMQVPQKLKALWSQRKRWARGQGEVLHKYLPQVWRWRNRHLWLLAAESVLSMVWVICFALSLVLSVLNVFLGHALGFFAFGLGWGAAIAIVATVQLCVAVSLRHKYGRFDHRALLLGALYPVAYWSISALAALRSQIVAFFRGPPERHATWSIARESVDGDDAPGKSTSDG
ncbi:glycosyltransferase family 2 protein [Saccharomonospora sp. CUA-673]|uniref:glycosyltransferase n=1 Tax=Saccharomonospora sp. CUA-673 TaxID=1904969 RepID=UPI001300E137|nr:glycosyltransferase family 2 protein [Saccharomonospora sp. CUA-673]